MARVYIVDRLTPSTTHTQHVEVSNTTNGPLTVDIYPGAATNIGGNFLPSNPGVSNDLVAWTTVSPSTVVIAAHGYARATVTIKVPDVVTPGELNGLIWASIKSTPNAQGITSVNRVGIRMYTPVGAAPATSTTMSNNHPWYSSKTAIEGFGISLLLALLLLFAFFAWRKKRKKEKKKEKKKKEKKRLKLEQQAASRDERFL